MDYKFLTDSEEKAVAAVRRGMTRSAAAKKFHVERNALNAMCRAILTVEPKVGRPKKKK